MKDEIGEYIEIFEVIGAHNNSRHQAVVARAANNETFVKILKKISLLKHQNDRSHRIYRAYSDKMLEKYSRFFAECSFKEFNKMVEEAFNVDAMYYVGNSRIRQIEKKIDEAVAQELDEMMKKHETIFRTWDDENGFDFKNFDNFFPRISKAYLTFESKR